MFKTRFQGYTDSPTERPCWGVYRDGEESPLFVGNVDDCWQERTRLTASVLLEHFSAGGIVVEDCGSWSTRWEVAKSRTMTAQKMADHVANRHVGFGWSLVLLPAGTPDPKDAENAVAASLVRAAMEDGRVEINTLGGWMSLEEWAFGPRDESSAFELRSMVAEYQPERPALLGPLCEPLIIGTTEAGRFVWPVR
jgi:hypothetical protein